MVKQALAVVITALFSQVSVAKDATPVDVVIACWADNRCPHIPYENDGKTLSLKWKRSDAEKVIAGMNAGFVFKGKPLATYILRNFSMIVDKTLTNPVDVPTMFDEGSAIAADGAVTIFIVKSLLGIGAGGIANIDPLTYGTKPILFVYPGNVGLPVQTATSPVVVAKPVVTKPLPAGTPDPSMMTDPAATPAALSPLARNIGWFDMATSHEMMHISGMNHTADSSIPEGSVNPIYYDETSICGPDAVANYFQRNQNDYPVVDLIANLNHCERNNSMHYGNGFNVYTDADGYFVYDRCGKPSIFSSSDATTAKTIMSCFGERFRRANQ